MLHKLAQFFSYIFHPLLAPSFATTLIVLANPYMFAGLAKGPFSVLAIIMPLTVMFPVIALLLMKALKLVDDLYLQDAKQRILPFIAIMIFYFWAYIVVMKQNMPALLVWTMLGSCIAIVIAFILNSFFKISLHTIGMGGLVIVALKLATMAYFNFTPLVILVLIVAGIIGSCRLYLKAHTNQEVYLGYWVGMVGMIIANWWI